MFFGPVITGAKALFGFLAALPDMQLIGCIMLVMFAMVCIGAVAEYFVMMCVIRRDEWARKRQHARRLASYRRRYGVAR